MKKIYKLFLVILIYFLILFLLDFVIENIDAVILLRFSEYDISDFRYDFRKQRIFNILLVTAIFFGVLCIIWEMVDNHVRNRKTLFISIFMGDLFIICSFTLYWGILQNVCLEIEDSRFMFEVERCFGSISSMKKFWLIFMCTIFGFEIFLSHFEYFYSEKRKRLAYHQIFYNVRFFEYVFCICASTLLLISGTLYYECFKMLLLCYILGDLVYFLKQIGYFIMLNGYYEEIEKNNENWSRLVIVCEDNSNNQSLIFNKFFCSKMVMDKFRKEEIYLYPGELAINMEAYVEVDIYNPLLFSDIEQKMRQQIELFSRKQGVFHLAVCEDDSMFEYLDGLYDIVESDIDKTVEDIIVLSRYKEFRKKQTEILNKLETNRLTKTNCIIDEIVHFKSYLMDILDEFLVFDYSIKWLEIVNYLYVLVGISQKKSRYQKQLEIKLTMQVLGHGYVFGGKNSRKKMI